MSVNTVTYTPNCSGPPDMQQYTQMSKQAGIEIIGFLASSLSGCAINNLTSATIADKTTDVEVWETSAKIPEWVRNVGCDNYAGTYGVIGSVSFDFKGVSYCFVKNGYFYGDNCNDYARLYLFIKTSKESKRVTIVDYNPYNAYNNSTYLLNGRALDFLIGSSADYFFIKRIYSSTATRGNICYFGVFNCVGLNTNDTNCSITINNGLTTVFNTAYATEDITQTALLIKEMALTETDPFVKNIYIDAIPLYRVYAASAIYGVRGQVKNLFCAPANYSTNNQMYNIGGEVYFGLGNFDGAINGNGSALNVLLKV